MNIRKAFPSKYLKAGDLDGKRVTLTIDRVEVESLGQGNDQEEKPILYFVGKDKGLVLNVTNTNTIVMDIASGDEETDNWHGLRCTLYESKTEMGGKRVPCLRIDPAPVGAVTARTVQSPRPAPPPPPVQQVPADDFQVSDDDVPFAVFLPFLAGLVGIGGLFV